MSTNKFNKDNLFDRLYDRSESELNPLQYGMLSALLPFYLTYKYPKVITSILALGVTAAGVNSCSKYINGNQVTEEPAKTTSEYKIFKGPNIENSKDLETKLEPKKYNINLKSTFNGVVNYERIRIQKFTANAGRFVNTDTKEELYLACNKTMTECSLGNNQPLSNEAMITGLKINKNSGARVIACPDSNIDKAILSNAKHGFETLAIVGTGTVAQTNPKLLKEIQSQKSNHVFSFQDKSGVWRSPAGDQFVRFPDRTTLETNYRGYYKKTKQNIKMRDAGFYTMNDGNIYLLDFMGKSIAERDKKLDELTKNPNV